VGVNEKEFLIQLSLTAYGMIVILAVPGLDKHTRKTDSGLTIID